MPRRAGRRQPPPPDRGRRGAGRTRCPRPARAEVAGRPCRRRPAPRSSRRPPRSPEYLVPPGVSQPSLIPARNRRASALRYGRGTVVHRVDSGSAHCSTMASTSVRRCARKVTVPSLSTGTTWGNRAVAFSVAAAEVERVTAASLPHPSHPRPPDLDTTAPWPPGDPSARSQPCSGDVRARACHQREERPADPVRSTTLNGSVRVTSYAASARFHTSVTSRSSPRVQDRRKAAARR